MSKTVAKCCGKEWTEEELRKLSAGELGKLMDDLSAQRLAAKSQGKAVKRFLSDRLRAENLLAKLGGLKEAEAEALLKLLKEEPERAKAAIAAARKHREEIRVTASLAGVGVSAAAGGDVSG